MKILLAVSGGPDSMCMADIFSRRNMGDGIAVAHCNFHLRGSESDGDESLVRSWADSHGLECYVADFETEKYARDHGISIEMAARDLRYAWFARIAREKGFDAVCVAHNADDNAETLILNLLRGTGVKGASGMTAEGLVPGAPDIVLLRPLLGMSRKDIEKYNSEHSVPFRIDSTNLESDYKRNRIRHQVMPVFSEINPSYLQTLSKDMEAFAQVSRLADDYYDAVRAKVVLEEGCDRLKIDSSSLLSDRHWRYILFRLLDKFGFSRGDLDALCHLLEGGGTISGKKFSSPSHTLVTGSSTMSVIPNRESAFESESVTVTSEGEYSVLGKTIRVSVGKWSDDMPLGQEPGVLVLDASRLGFPFDIRRWAPGDWMCPLGLGGKRKKISDILHDLKMDILQKENALVVCIPGQEKSVALVGLRIDESVKVSSSTASVVRIALV